MRGIRIYHSQAVVQVLTKSLRVLPNSLSLPKGAYQVAIEPFCLSCSSIARAASCKALLTLLCQLPYRRVHSVVPSRVDPSLFRKTACDLE